MMHSAKNPEDGDRDGCSCARIKTSYPYRGECAQGTTQVHPLVIFSFISFTVFKLFVLMQNTCTMPVGNCVLCGNVLSSRS